MIVAILIISHMKYLLMSKQSYISETSQHWSWSRVRMTTAARRRLMRDFKRLQVIIIFNEVHLDAVSKIIVISSSTTVVQFPALIGGPSGWGVWSSRGEQHYVVERCDLRSPRDSL